KRARQGHRSRTVAADVKAAGRTELQRAVDDRERDRLGAAAGVVGKRDGVAVSAVEDQDRVLVDDRGIVQIADRDRYGIAAGETGGGGGKTARPVAEPDAEVALVVRHHQVEVAVLIDVGERDGNRVIAA